jgi:hypothetical protein
VGPALKEQGHLPWAASLKLPGIARADAVTFEVHSGCVAFSFSRSIRMNSLKSGMMAKGTPFVTIPTQKIQRNPRNGRPKDIAKRDESGTFPLHFQRRGFNGR